MRRARVHGSSLLAPLALLAGAAGQSAPASRSSASRSSASQPGPTVAEIRALLRSDASTDVSWGAWHSSAGRLKNVLPDLEAALARCDRQEEEIDIPWTLAARGVLDALIQTDARVAPPVLARWGQRAAHVPAVLVLASRDPRGNAALLGEVVDTADPGWRNDEWLAACNLLLSGDPAGLLERLSASIAPVVTVAVHDGLAGGGTSRSIRMVADARFAVPEGFAPVVINRLARSDNARGAEVFAPGPIAIRHSRIVMRGRTVGTGATTQELDRADYAVQCLCWLAEVPPDQRLRAAMAIDHTWRDEATWRESVGAQVHAIRASWGAALDRLVARGVLQRRLADELRHRLAVDVKDQRQSDRSPLPDLDESPASRPASRPK